MMKKYIFTLCLGFIWNVNLALAQIPIGPYLQPVGETYVGINGFTNGLGNGNCLVKYGTSLSSLNQTSSSFACADHFEVEIHALSADTRYFYRVQDSTGTIIFPASNNQYFQTFPPKGSSKPIRVAVFGDPGDGPGGIVAQVLNAFDGFTGSQHVHALLTNGDNAYSVGSYDQFKEKFFASFQNWTRKFPVFPVMGNHDTDIGEYKKVMHLPQAGESGGVSSSTEEYYSYTIGSAHFIALNSNSESLTSLSNATMFAWLLDDLRQSYFDSQIKWLIVYFHHGPYSNGSHESDTEKWMQDMRENYLPFFEQYGVDLVLGGHSHNYERSYYMRGHGGIGSVAASFNPASFPIGNVVQPGDGRVQGDGAYMKSPCQRGTVYTTIGNSSKGGSFSGKPFYSAMPFSVDNTNGSLILDITPNQLDYTYLNKSGVIQDSFRISRQDTCSASYLACAQSSIINGSGFIHPLKVNGTSGNPLGQMDVFSGSQATITLDSTAISEPINYFILMGYLTEPKAIDVTPSAWVGDLCFNASSQNYFVLATQFEPFMPLDFPWQKTFPVNLAPGQTVVLQGIFASTLTSYWPTYVSNMIVTHIK